MINPQLLNYVRAQRAAGVPKEEIIKALSGGGWSAQDAQEAFAALEGVQVPPTAPKPPPPSPITPPVTVVAPTAATSTPAPQPRPIQPPVQQPFPVTPPMQASVRMQPQPVVQRQPIYAQVKKRRRIWPWMFMLILFLLIGFCAGAYASMKYSAVQQMVIGVESLIFPPTLAPVPAEETDEEPELPSFMPTTPTLGTDTTTGTSTASTTAN